MHRSEDGGTVVGDIDVFVLGSCGNRHEDFIHASWTEGGLDEISDCDGANKRRLNERGSTKRAIYPFYSFAPYLTT